MFRALCIYSKRLLVPRPLPALTLDSPSSGPTAIYDVRRNNQVKEYHRPLHPLTNRLYLHPLIGHVTLFTGQNMRWASDKSQGGFQMPDPALIVCELQSMLKCVDLNDLKDAPPPVFWSVLAYGGMQLMFPFLELIGGYSPVLTFFQLYSAAIAVSYASGTFWGVALSEKSPLKPTWEVYRATAIPPAMALAGLILPYPIAFLATATAWVSALYFLLKSCAFPAWSCAAQLLMCLASIVGLLLALMAYVLFHNRENNKKKVKSKEAAQEAEYDEEEDEDKDKDKKEKP